LKDENCSKLIIILNKWKKGVNNSFRIWQKKNSFRIKLATQKKKKKTNKKKKKKGKKKKKEKKKKKKKKKEKKKK